MCEERGSKKASASVSKYIDEQTLSVLLLMSGANIDGRIVNKQQNRVMRTKECD